MTVHTVLTGDCDQSVTPEQIELLLRADLAEEVTGLMAANPGERLYVLTQDDDVDAALSRACTK